MNIQKLKRRLPFKTEINKCNGVIYTKSNYADVIKKEFKIESLFLMNDKEKKALHKYFVKYWIQDIKRKAESQKMNDFKVILHDIKDMELIKYASNENEMFVLFNLSYTIEPL